VFMIAQLIEATNEGEILLSQQMEAVLRQHLI